MSRRRNNDTQYIITAVLPSTGQNIIVRVDTLEQGADVINDSLFNGFEVFTRNMLSNWLYYPSKRNGRLSDNIDIQKTTIVGERNDVDNNKYINQLQALNHSIVA